MAQAIRGVSNFTKKINLSNYSLVTQIIIVNLLTAISGLLFLLLFNYLLISGDERINNQIETISDDLNQAVSFLSNNAIIRIPQFNEEFCESLNIQSNDECGDIILSNPQLDPTSTQRFLFENYLNDQNIVKVYDDSWIKFADTADIYISSDVVEIDIEKPSKKPSLYEQYKYNYLKYYNFFQENFSKNKIFSKISKYKGDIFLVKETIKKQTDLSYIYLNENDNAIIVNSKPIIKNNNIFGVVLVSGPIIREDNDSGLISFNLINLYIIIVCIMFLLSTLFLQSIVSPITTLSKIVRLNRQKSSKSEKKFTYPDRKDEIGILSNDIQSMLDDLKRRINEIEGFAADVSHELKNPIASLKSSNELLLGNKISDEKKLLLIGNMKKDIDRMNTLITDISAYTLTQVEIDDELFYKFDLVDFLNDLLKSYDSNTKKIKINFEYDKRETFIYANKDKLARVFINLIDNSVSYSPIKSEILIKLLNLNDSVSIIITDQGPGISRNLWNKVFERFYTDRKFDQDKNHSGLGLSISKKIIESFSGSLRLTTIKSQQYIGACFEINLPLKE